MNEIRKEKLRIVNLVDEINERGIARLSVDIGSPGSTPLRVWVWSPEDHVVRDMDAHGSALHPQLRKIRHDLEQMLKAGKVPAMEVAA